MDRLNRDELFYCIVDGKEEEALRLLAQTEDVNRQDKNVYSYLHIAVQEGRNRIVAALLERGAEVDIRDQFGKTPLMVAVFSYKHNGRSCIDLLLEYGADRSLQANSGVSCEKLAQMIGFVW